MQRSLVLLKEKKVQNLVLTKLYDFLLALHHAYWTYEPLFKREIKEFSELPDNEFEYIFNRLLKRKFFFRKHLFRIRITFKRIKEIESILKAYQGGDVKPLMEFAVKYGFLKKECLEDIS